MMFSIFILATVVAAIWRTESLNQRNEERLDSLDELFHGIATVQGLAFKQIDELKAFVDKHVKNPEVANIVQLKQAEIIRDLEDASMNVTNKGITFCAGDQDAFNLEAADRTYADKMPKKVANKKRKKK